jgi:hypothetical protein
MFAFVVTALNFYVEHISSVFSYSSMAAVGLAEDNAVVIVASIMVSPLMVCASAL